MYRNKSLYDIIPIYFRCSTKQRDSHVTSSHHGLDFYAFITPFIICVGLFGNCTSLCIFRKRKLRRLSASLILSSICISDICVLLTYVLLDWLNKGLPRWPGRHRVPFVTIDGFCQTFLFVSYTFRIISVWLIIVFTLERYVAICWPIRSRLICTHSFSLRMIGCVSLAAALLCIYKPIISGVYVSGHIKVCSKLLQHERLNYVLDSIYGILITALPFCIITILNVLILRKLVWHSNEHVEIRSTSTNEQKMKYEFTVILLSISTCFVCLNLPYFIVWCQRFSIVNKMKTSSPLEDMIQSLEKDDTHPDYLLVTRTIFYINYSINFFLYCLTGKQYRKYMKELFCCRKENKPSSYGQYCQSGHSLETYVPKSTADD